jgi:hypothetical protein
VALGIVEWQVQFATGYVIRPLSAPAGQRNHHVGHFSRKWDKEKALNSLSGFDCS